MPVRRAEACLEVRPDEVYLLPARKEKIISDRRLRLLDKEPGKTHSLPIDTFFRSLGQDLGEQAIGIICSGTGSDGNEIARVVRKNRALDRVRLVALTGSGRPEDRSAVMQAGFNDHLVKPVHPRDSGDCPSPKAAAAC